MNSAGKPVAVVIGATSKWQSDGRNTHLVHGGDIDDSELPAGVRWGVGGAISLKFAQEGFFTVLTTRNAANAAPLEAAIREQGNDGMIVELDLASRDSISNAFARIRESGCRFLVAARLDPSGGRVRTLADCAVPRGFERLFEAIPLADFRMDLSSTELRERRRALSLPRVE